MGSGTKGELKTKRKKAKIPSDSETEGDVYTVEAVVDKKYVDGKALYHVKWKDWPHSSNTWEPKENLKGAPDVLAEFERNYQTKGSGGFSLDNNSLEESSNYETEDDIDKTTSSTTSIEVDVLEECPDKEPDQLLGVVPISGTITYLVRWKNQGSTQTKADDNEADMSLVRGDIFKRAYPQTVIAFYEKNIVWASDERLQDVLASDAIRNVAQNKGTLTSSSALPSTTPEQMSSAKKATQQKETEDFQLSSDDSETGSENEKMEVDPIV